MSDTPQGPVFTKEDKPELNELALLKERAQEMGIPIRGNVSIETLKTRIADKMAGKALTDEDGDAEGEATYLTKAQLRQKMMDDAKREGLRMRRVQINNLNPRKSDLSGEVITVGNEYIGTIRRFVPFGEATEGGWHVEQVIYDYMKAKKFQHVRVVKNKQTGAMTPVSTWVNEYSITDMPPLTEEELAELRLAQQAAERVGV